MTSDSLIYLILAAFCAAVAAGGAVWCVWTLAEYLLSGRGGEEASPSASDEHRGTQQRGGLL